MIKKVYAKAIAEVYENKSYLILSFIISSYVFTAQLIVYNAKRQILAVVISIFLLFLISKLSKLVFSLVSLSVLLITGILLHINYHWGTGSLVERLQAAMLSPPYESIEYLSNYFNYFDSLILLYYAVGIYLLSIYMVKFNYSFRILKIPGVIILSMAYLILSNTVYIKMIEPYKHVPKLLLAGEWKDIVDRRLVYLDELNIEKKSIRGDVPNYEKIILIMGESVNKSHLGVYDYNVPTTPFLSQLATKQNSYIFDNVIAAANQTRYSIPISLTDIKVNEFSQFPTSKSIVSVFKEYGFKTYWLSNQYMAGMHDSYIATISSEADYSKTENFCYVRGGGAKSEHDMVLIDYLSKLDINNNNKEVYFIHLLGSHFQYNKRYPDGAGIYAKPGNIVDEYDNSIHYSDDVMSMIYDLFKDKNILFIYTADHGEVVHKNKSGHGFIPSYQDEYNIPLVIFSSLDNKRLVTLKDLNTKKLFNTASFNHILQYIVGIENDTSKISTDASVIDVDLENIQNYYALGNFEDKRLSSN